MARPFNASFLLFPGYYLTRGRHTERPSLVRLRRAKAKGCQLLFFRTAARWGS
jgi:hypothetical protein